MMYQIFGILISIVLILVGVIKDYTSCLIAGIVFLCCNIGAIVGILLKNKKEKLFPIIISVGIIITILVAVYLYILRVG